MLGRRHHRALVAGSALLGLIAGLVFWLALTAPEPVEPVDAQFLSESATSPQPLAATTRAESSYRRLPSSAESSPDRHLREVPELLPASLMGSQPDGEIEFDEDGRLLLTSGLRDRFDYWLTAFGELELPAIRSRLRQSLAPKFDAEQLAAILAEFDLYSAYLEAVDELLPLDFGTLRERQAALVALQQELLGQERASAWFGHENRYIERSLGVLDGEIVAGDPASDPFAEEILRTSGHHLALEMNRQYAHASIGAEQRHQERSALFGAEAAERLAQLDAEQAEWQSRLQQFAWQRESLLNNQRLTEAERLELLERFLQNHFDEHERRRVIALAEAGLLDSDRP